MPDPADAFLDAAVRSFDDHAELQMIARSRSRATRGGPVPGEAAVISVAPAV